MPHRQSIKDVTVGLPLGHELATPFRLHSLDEKPPYLHPHESLPFFDQWWDCLPQQLTMPFFDNSLPLRFAGASAHMKYHLPVTQLNRRWLSGLHNFQQISFSPDVVTFSVDIVARGLAFLLPQFVLLLLDPRQLRNREDFGPYQGSYAQGRQCAPGRSADGRSDEHS